MANERADDVITTTDHSDVTVAEAANNYKSNKDNQSTPLSESTEGDSLYLAITDDDFEYTPLSESTEGDSLYLAITVDDFDPCSTVPVLSENVVSDDQLGLISVSYAATASILLSVGDDVTRAAHERNGQVESASIGNYTV